MPQMIVREITETVYEIPEGMSESQAIFEAANQEFNAEDIKFKTQYEFISGGK